ncbi:glycosyltransferase family 4 protein [Ancylobacter sonchi]|uniref:glycosyltransferase family 4 protein n=1 Tax=Ancylobacter sonchi TaxID=1937790 RepID=UPI001BD31744|nr:glycosyltransferase family 4 protein [Ancylobacter sonchi]MBS7533413.1 glycosyltransferase family 4 protein [Ancylobacter sonchi]
MSGFAFAIPGDIDLATGGYGYDRRVIAECGRAGCTVTHLALPDTFPFPSPEDLARSEERLKALPAGQPLLIDGLAMGALPASLLRGLDRPIAALVHHPLALETGLDNGQQARLMTSERAALSIASVVIVTSPATARLLERDLGIGRDRIVVAVPGNDPCPRARGTGAPMRLLSVGAVIPRKAHGILVDALARLAALDWSCRIVGSTDRDADEVHALRRRIETHGLEGRITLTGAVSEGALALEFDAADLFVSASLFEGYGMSLTEALARGLPIVATRTGAIPETVPPEASLLAPPNDAAGLAEGIRLLHDPDRRHAMAEAAWRRAETLPRWPRTATTIMATMQEIAR